VQWEGFLQMLNNVFYSEPFSTGQIAEKLNDKTWEEEKHASLPTDKAIALRAALPDFLAEGLNREGFFQRRAGHCFAERVGKRFGKSQVHLKRGEVSHGAQQWQVIFGSDPAATGELGELAGSYETE
jgi:hypothetical protein